MPRGKRPASYLSVAMQAQYSIWSPIDHVSEKLVVSLAG